MQKMMLPDILDGTRKVKHDRFDALISICKAWKYVDPIDEKSWRMDFHEMHKDNFYIFHDQDGLPISNRRTHDLLSQDQSLNNLLRAYSDYMKSEKNNYLISENLSKAFAKTSSAISTKYLPENFQGYIQIPGLLDQDGWDIEGFFVSIYKYETCWKFYAGYLSNNPDHNNLDASFINIDLSSAETVEECVKKMPYVRQWINKNTFEYQTEESPSEYNTYIHVLFNAVMYIAHGEDVSKTKNVFSTKRSKRVAQEKLFTPKVFTKVGYNMQLPRTYNVDSTVVSGHFRWQPHGPGRSLVKHIYIDPHPRHYNKET